MISGSQKLVPNYTSDEINPIWNTTWRWGQGSNELAGKMSIFNNNVFTVGVLYKNISLPPDTFLLKLDTDGNIIWNRTCGGSDEESISSCSIDNTGIYLAGYKGNISSGDYDVLLLKYNSDGTMQFNKTWGKNKAETASSIALDSSNIFIGGIKDNYSASNKDGFLAKFDKNGNEIWNRSWGGGNYDVLYSITLDTSYIYATGLTRSFFPGQDSLFIIKYDKNGNFIWEKVWDKKSCGAEITVDSSYLYVAGELRNTTLNYDTLIMKLDKNSNIQWNRSWGGSGRDSYSSIATGTSFVYMCGISEIGGPVTEDFITKYDKVGNKIWTKWYSNNSKFNAITVDSNYIYCSGISSTSDTELEDVIILKTDLSGGNSSVQEIQGISSVLTIALVLLAAVWAGRKR